MAPPQRIKRNFQTDISLPTDAVKSQAPEVTTVHQNMERRVQEERAKKLYLKKYPWAKDWNLKNLIEFERNARPVSVNGVVRTPVTYKPKQTTISQDTRTESQHKLGQQAAQKELEKSKQLKETEQAIEVINNPYNPIGWIPGVRTIANVGASNLYSRLTGQVRTPYTADALISAGIDALTLGFGIGPWKNYVGSYAGTVAGGMIGEQFDSPHLGQLIGGMTGGFTSNLYNSAKTGVKNILISRSLNQSVRNSPHLNVYTSNPNIPQNIRYKFGDLELNNPSLLYHQDWGDYKGWNYPLVKGGYIKRGAYYPGDISKEDQLAYSWWNLGNPYKKVLDIKNPLESNPTPRVIITTNSPQFLHIRSQPYRIGQWDPNAKRSFVLQSEFVTPDPVKLSPRQIFYYDKAANAYVRQDKLYNHSKFLGDVFEDSNYLKIPLNLRLGTREGVGGEQQVFRDRFNPEKVLKVRSEEGHITSPHEYDDNWWSLRNEVPYQHPIEYQGFFRDFDRNGDLVIYPTYSQDLVQPLGDDAMSADIFNSYLQRLSKQMLEKGWKQNEAGFTDGSLQVGDINPGNLSIDQLGNIGIIDGQTTRVEHKVDWSKYFQ